MSKGKITTSNEYVTAKLLETEELLAKELARNAALEKDVEAFQGDILVIQDHFKVELHSTETELKISFYEEPSSKYAYGNALAFSDSLEPANWKKEFDLLVTILKLKDRALEIVTEKINDLITE